MHNRSVEGVLVDFGQATAINQAIRLLALRHRARISELLAPLGLHSGQEALLLALDKSGPLIQAQLSEVLSVEPPSVTLMTRKLEAAGYLRRTPTSHDKRASVVDLTASGRELVEQVKALWLELAEETVAGVAPEIVASLPGVLAQLTSNVDTRRPPLAKDRRKPGLRAEP